MYFHNVTESVKNCRTLLGGPGKTPRDVFGLAFADALPDYLTTYSEYDNKHRHEGGGVLAELRPKQQNG